MRTDAEVARAADRTAEVVLRLVKERDAARSVAVALEAQVARVEAVESAMAGQALAAWRTATARYGCSDEDALTQHADTLTRWSERIRMALRGDLTGDEEWLRAALNPEPTP